MAATARRGDRDLTRGLHCSPAIRFSLAVCPTHRNSVADGLAWSNAAADRPAQRAADSVTKPFAVANSDS